MRPECAKTKGLLVPHPAAAATAAHDDDETPSVGKGREAGTGRLGMCISNEHSEERGSSSSISHHAVVPIMFSMRCER